jgi:hypothetical protein
MILVTPEMYTRSPAENPCGAVVVNVTRDGVDPLLGVKVGVVVIENDKVSSDELGYM